MMSRNVAFTNSKSVFMVRTLIEKKTLEYLSIFASWSNQNPNVTDDANISVPSSPPSVRERGNLTTLAGRSSKDVFIAGFAVVGKRGGRTRWRILSVQLQPCEVSGRENRRLTRTIWGDKLRGGSNFCYALHTWIRPTKD